MWTDLAWVQFISDFSSPPSKLQLDILKMSILRYKCLKTAKNNTQAFETEKPMLKLHFQEAIYCVLLRLKGFQKVLGWQNVFKKEGVCVGIVI